MINENIETNGRHEMTLNDYQDLAVKTRNQKLSKDKHLLNGALGLNGESGEVADIIKKHYMQGHPLDIDHTIEEIGDTLWYIADLCTTLGISLEEVAQRNYVKLSSRYPKGFDTSKSVGRSV